MDLQMLTYLVVGATFVLYIIIAVASRAHDTSEFYVAGKHVHPIANGMATAADWMSAASFISMAGLIAFLGYEGTVYLMGILSQAEANAVTDRARQVGGVQKIVKLFEYLD